MDALYNEGVDLDRGVYDARRAAALAGVPMSTLHYWARHDIYVPSISPDPHIRYWSWLDLVALRAIDWLRQPKPESNLPRVTMPKIRRALKELAGARIPLFQLEQVVSISQSGEMFFDFGENVVRAAPGRQSVMREVLALVRPYKHGPDLLKPRPRLRIIPGKLHGEPHLVGTRIPSAAVYSLHRSGYSLDSIQRLYPEADLQALQEAIDLEASLAPAA